MKSNYEMVRDFHSKFGCTLNSKPTQLTEAEKLLRIRLMNEELAELVAAIQLGDMELIADSIGDLLYVTYGTGAAYGMPINQIYHEIHTSNMTKSLDKDTGGKVTKGDSFVPPRLGWILEQAADEDWYYNLPEKLNE